MGALIAVVIAVVVDYVAAQRTTFLSIPVAAIVASGLALIVLLYARSCNPPFMKFVLAAIGASAVFALFSAASRVTEAPYVRPVAMVLNGKPLGGIYITASNDHVFIGEVCAAARGSRRGNATTGSLVDVPRAEISLMMIGNNAGLEEAIQREQSLLESLPHLARITGTQIAAVAPTQGEASCTGPSAALMAR
jgi:hypothetical protein